MRQLLSAPVPVVDADPSAPGTTAPGCLGVDLFTLCRPRQWVKNVFVLSPLLFGELLLVGQAVGHALLAFASFCLLSSAVYVVNDILDRRADRQHPRKKDRPVASGRVSVAVALPLAGLLVALAAGLGLLLPPLFLLHAGLYLANSLLYCLFTKQKVIADVMAIAIGFVLRILAGCAAISVTPSSWIIVCGFSLALVLGFGKRRSEVAQLGQATGYRLALQRYGPGKLDTLLAIATAVTLLAYMLYTVAPETALRHGTGNLIYTVPPVAYGLFRYLFKAQDGNADGPTDILLGDGTFAIVGLVWLLSVLLVLHWR